MLKIRHSIEKDNTGHTEVKQTEPYIIFTVNNEEFGVEVQRVLELVKFTAPLKMPSNFINVYGMTIFRGKIIPIIDLRIIFGLEPVEYDANTVTIVVESSLSAFGVIAERVLDLNLVPVTSIKKVTAFNLGEKTKYLKSVANFGERLILLLDIDKMIETKRTQTTFEEPVQSQSFTKDKMPAVFLEIEGDDRITGNIFAREFTPDLSLDDSIDLQAIDTTTKLTEHPKESEEDKPITQPEESQVVSELSSSYLIDPKELEELLNEITSKPEPKAESKLLPLEEIDYVSSRLSTREVDPMEFEGVLAEPEREDEEEDQTAYQFGAEFDKGSPPEDLNKVNPIPSSESQIDGVLEPEQVEEILSYLESDLTLDLSEDFLRKKTIGEISIDPNQTKQGLSDEIIESILNELEDELQSGLKGSSSNNGNQIIKLDHAKNPGEKSDV